MFIYGPTDVIVQCECDRVTDQRKSHRVAYKMHLLAGTRPHFESLSECGQSVGVPPMELHEHDPQSCKHRKPRSPIHSKTNILPPNKKKGNLTEDCVSGL